MTDVDPALVALAADAAHQAHALACISPVTAYLLSGALILLAVALLPAADPRL